MQRSVFDEVGRIHVRAARDEEIQRLLLAPLRRMVQRRLLSVVPGVHRFAGVDPSPDSKAIIVEHKHRHNAFDAHVAIVYGARDISGDVRVRTFYRGLCCF